MNTKQSGHFKVCVFVFEIPSVKNAEEHNKLGSSNNIKSEGVYGRRKAYASSDNTAE